MFEWSAGRLNGAKLHLKQAAAVIHLRVLTPTATTTTTTTTTIRHMTATDAHYPQFDAFFSVFHFRKLTLSLPFFLNSICHHSFSHYHFFIIDLNKKLPFFRINSSPAYLLFAKSSKSDINFQNIKTAPFVNACFKT